MLAAGRVAMTVEQKDKKLVADLVAKTASEEVADWVA